MQFVRLKASGKKFHEDECSQLVAKYRSENISWLILMSIKYNEYSFLIMILSTYTHTHTYIFISSPCGYSEAVCLFSKRVDERNVFLAALGHPKHFKISLERARNTKGG